MPFRCFLAASWLPRRDSPFRAPRIQSRTPAVWSTRTTVNPYYPHRDFPKLITPQWVGEPGVEAVVVLAIDDMRDPARYEAYLRPILNRLKAIDGRRAGQHHDEPGQPERPAAPGVAQGRAVARVPHADPPLPAACKGGLRRGRPHLSWLRRPDEPDPRQQAGRLSDALLRLDQHREPALLRRDLQQDQPRRASSSRSTRRSSRSSRPTIRACRASWSSIPTARSGSASTSRSRRSSTRSRTTLIPT